MEHLERIRKMMEDAGVDSIDFMLRTGPSITIDCRRYEIKTIYRPDDDENFLWLSLVSSSPFGLEDLKIDFRNRKSTWKMLERIVEREIARLDHLLS